MLQDLPVEALGFHSVSQMLQQVPKVCITSPPKSNLLIVYLLDEEEKRQELEEEEEEEEEEKKGVGDKEEDKENAVSSNITKMYVAESSPVGYRQWSIWF